MRNQHRNTQQSPWEVHRRRWWSVFDPFWAICLLLGLWLFHPLLRDGLPSAADGLLHFYRTVLWRWSWDAGVLWPRWHTLLYQGYGYPLFNFYAPLLYLSSGLLDLVAGNILLAFKIVLFLSCVGYALGAYVWTKEFLGSWGAIVAAAAYAFTPFRLRELYFQGNYAQFLAWSIYPFVLFSWYRLVRAPDRNAFWRASLSLAALLLAHNISALLMAPVLLSYVGLWSLKEIRERMQAGDSWRLAVRCLMGPLLAGVCAVFISAIFWLPALGEARFTQVHLLTKGYFDIGENFLRLADILAPAPLLDLRAANPPLPFHFGRLHLALAALGALLLLRRQISTEERWQLGYALVATAGAVFLMLPGSEFLWRTVPLLPFAEFPARFYGIAHLFGAYLAGASLQWLAPWRRVYRLASVGIILGLLGSQATYLFPQNFLRPDISPRGFHAYEVQFNALGTTTVGEYLSIWTAALPPGPAVSFDEKGEVRRLSMDAGLEGAGRILQTGPEEILFELQLDAPRTVQVAQFYFPGWQAFMDGLAWPIEPCGEAGLICIRLPAGSHTVHLTFQDTWIRRLATWLTLFGGLLVIALAFLRQPDRHGGRLLASMPRALQGGWKAGGWISSILLLGLMLKFFWIEPHTTWFRVESPPDQALPATYDARLTVGDSTTGDEVTLLGYDIEPSIVQHGDVLHVRLYWQASHRTQGDYSSFVHLVVDPDNRALGGSDNMHPGNIPTSTWRTDRYTVDDHWIPIEPETPPVAVKLEVGLYDLRSGARLGEVFLPEYVHVRSAAPRPRDAIPYPLDAEFANGVRLLGYEWNKEEGQPTLVLFWETSQSLVQDLQIFMHVLDEDGAMIAQEDGPPLRGMYPTSRWLPGQTIVDSHALPASLVVQPHVIKLGLYDLASGQRVPVRHADGSPWAEDAVVIPMPGDN
ncbi:MAG: hypothetical protein D6790_21370 [Caldilineae bacterium]|nr:MAG: hypothetical protein D6790_21370 [Caldilineae bacterium]